MPIKRAIRRAYALHDIISAFAEVDVMHSHLARRVGYAAGVGFAADDDFFHGVYSLQIISKHKMFLVFTGYKTRMAHEDAIKAMGPFGKHLLDAAYDDREGEIKFRKNSWAGGDDLSIAMEERAMTAICEALKVAKPDDWRARREAIAKEHAVHALTVLPAEDAPPPPPPAPLCKCACGNLARPHEMLCNACVQLLAAGGGGGAGAKRQREGGGEGGAPAKKAAAE